MAGEVKRERQPREGEIVSGEWIFRRVVFRRVGLEPNVALRRDRGNRRVATGRIKTSFKEEEVFRFLLRTRAELKKKSSKPKRPTVKSLFNEEWDSASPPPAQGSFLSLLPSKLEVSKQDGSA